MRRAPVATLLLVVLLAAACGASAPSSGTGSTASTSAGASNSASASAAVASASPSGTSAPVSPEPSNTPDPSADVSPTADAPSEAPTDSAPPSPSPSPSASVAASPCQPEGNNKLFWPGIAKSVSWDVYCAVLPKGWILTNGDYRLANGGKLVVSYKGAGGATMTLSEGTFCKDGSGCVPSGSDAGDAAFGALGGTLVTTDAGGYAIVVARGDTPSWLLVTSGLDQATTVSLGAALTRVGG